MQKIIFGIFSHPDDETFGPCATLIKEVDEGATLHLIMLTDGQAGRNVDSHPDLGAVRLQEWQAATAKIGATSIHPLHYQDGEIGHNLYKQIGSNVRQIVQNELGKISEPAELCFMTFDQNGLTGHLDHIAASYITTQLFYTIADELPPHIQLKELAYYCLSREQAPNRQWSTYYMPIGRDTPFINRTIDIRSLLARKREVMKCHYTQRHDAETLLALGDEVISYEHFHVITP